MTRSELYRLLPDPDAVGQTEYRVLHDCLVDSVNEWISSESEDITGFVVAVLSEVSEWTSHLLTLISSGTSSVPS